MNLYEGAHIKETDQCATENSASKRRVRDDRYAELASGLEQVEVGVFYIERERGVLELHGRDRVHGMCSAECLGGTL